MMTITDARRIFGRTLFLAGLLLAAATVPAHAELTINIGQGVREPMPIAITELIGQSAEETRMGLNVAEHAVVTP